MNADFGTILIVILLVLLLFYINRIVSNLPKNYRLLYLVARWRANNKKTIRWLKAHREDIREDKDKTLTNPEIRNLLVEDIRLFDEIAAMQPDLEIDRGVRDYIAEILDKKNKNFADK